MFKPFYVHRNHAPGKMKNAHPRGFTALIQPTANPREVAMAVTFCSPKDEFNKKEGRSSARTPEKVEIVAAREVPKLLSGCSNVCGLHAVERDFLYVLKHML